MQRVFNRLIFPLLLLLVVAACQNPPVDNQAKTLVSFKGGSLTDLDLQAHYEKMRKDTMFRDKPDMLQPEMVFEHALNMEMIIALGLEKKLHLDPRVREELHSQMSKLFLNILQDELIEPLDRNSISNEQAREFYDANPELYQKKELYQVSAIQVAADQAAHVADKIRGGKLSFAEAATHHALDEQERSSGGRIGARALDRFRPHWRQHVEQLKVGEVYGPVELDGEQRLLLLEGKSEPEQYSFEEKKEYVRNDVLYKHYRDAWQEVYDDLRNRFKVKIDAEQLNDFYRNGLAEKKG